MSRSALAGGLLVRLWPLGKAFDRLAQVPLFGRFLRPCYGPGENQAIIIPVHQGVQGTESVVLPYSLLAPLVTGASARFILNECLCRRADNCRAHPHEIGCLFLGDGAARIHPALGHPVNVHAALAHIERGMADGLTPPVVHASFDAWALGIPYRRTLAICLCSDCCCTVRHSLRSGPAVSWDTVLRLPGLKVEVQPHCTGCGACLAGRPVKAITLVEGRALIDERCKGCGRCASACRAGAIGLQLDPETDVLARLTERIVARTDIGLGEQPARG